MTRELKFRAWDKNIEVMVEPENLHLDGSGLVAVYYQNCDDEESLWETDPNILANIELLEYTGLKDKNGEEIYEGDILSPKEHLLQEGNQVVEYHAEGGYSGFITSGELQFNECEEVIGNIYENKKLLRQT